MKAIAQQVFYGGTKSSTTRRRLSFSSSDSETDEENNSVDATLDLKGFPFSRLAQVTREKYNASGNVGGGENSGVSRFPSILVQDLSLFGRKIQFKDNKWIEENVSKNPRYLLTSSDSPAILHEGFRYNALHIAARWGNAWVTKFVLSTISDPKFMTMLYPEDNYQTTTQRVKFICDMYLNTPDRAAGETPLMFACKFNWLDVTSLLIYHPSCDMHCKNTIGQLAAEICGSRKPNDDKTTEKVVRLFFDDTIVPVWRDITGSVQPFVGRPVHLKKLGKFTPRSFTEPYGNIMVELLGEPDIDALPEGKFGAEWKVSAYAGPTELETAQMFYDAIKYKDFEISKSPAVSLTPGPARTPRTPIRSFTPFTSTTPVNSPRHRRGEENGSRKSEPPLAVCRTPLRATKDFGLYDTLRYKDFEITRSPSSKYSPGLRTPPRFDITPTTSPTPRRVEENRIRLADPHKGIERIGRRYAKELGTYWVEHWDVLDKFLNLELQTDLALLNEYLTEMERLIEYIVFDNLRVDEDDEDGGEFVDCLPCTAFLTGETSANIDFQMAEAVSTLDEAFLENYPAIMHWINAIKALGKTSNALKDVISGLENLKI